MPKPNLTPAVRCKVVNSEDQEYKPIPTPLHAGSYMLELCPPGEGYVFPAKIRATSAIWHTVEYRMSLGEECSSDEYIIFPLDRR